MRKSIVSILSVVGGGLVGAGAVKKISDAKTDKIQNMSDKHLALFLMMNQWVRVKQEGKKLDSYFTAHGYQKIAIYGMSYVGETLVSELNGSDIEIAYGIDQKEKFTYIDVITIENELPEVDAIVVTAITFYEEIEEKLREKVSCPVISLEDILYEI